MKISTVLLGMLLALFPTTLDAHINPAQINLTALTLQEKKAAVRSSAAVVDNCISAAVNADPRLETGDLDDLITDAFRHCDEAARELIATHDRYFGIGTGEKFFLGPYLDRLPATVEANLKKKGADAPASH